MQTKTFKVEKAMMLGAFIKANVFGAGFAFVKNILKSKDVKINGTRTSVDVMLNKGDTVQIYYAEDAIKNYVPFKRIYDDENILVVFKNQGIEVTSPHNKNTLEKLVGYEAVHRLDVNTEGLVIFAKNTWAAEELKQAFIGNHIKKGYLALVIGNLNKSPITLIGYLKKDASAGMVEVIKEKPLGEKGYVEIKTTITKIKPVREFNLLKIQPITGRTHQIRAHLASIKLYILGDGKYGNAKMNKVYGYTKQCLCASELEFDFPPEFKLSYLNKKKLEVTPAFLKTKN